MRDITLCHPDLQARAAKLLAACEAAGTRLDNFDLSALH